MLERQVRAARRALAQGRRLPGLLRAVRELYADAHLLDHLPPAVPAPAPDPGRLTISRLGPWRNRLLVAGATSAQAAEVRLGDVTRPVHLAGAAEGGMRAFTVELPRADGPITLALTGPDAVLTLAQPTPGAIAGARRRLARRFLGDLLRSAAPGMRWLVTGDVQAKARIREALGLGRLEPAPEIEPAMLAPATGPVATGASRVTIVLPVFNAFDLLAECLDRIEANTDLPWRLIALDDASTDGRVRPFLRGRVAAMNAARPGAVDLIVNDRNLGFIGTVNRGLAEAARDPAAIVVLLNTDAFVPPGWAGRLVAPLLADPAVASVTPLSNNAEILTAPAICGPAPVTPAEAAAADGAAARLDPLRAVAGVPTGVGFCMAMAPHWLARVPAFDTAFGRGYGEEVDWCRRTAALGARHLGSAAVFVEHRGGESFGSEAKRALIAENGARISARWPGFDRSVQEFIAADPLAGPRLAVGLAIVAAATDLPVPVYLAHALGGGAETDLQRRIGADLLSGGAAVVLRVGGPRRCQIELVTAQGATRGVTDDLALAAALLAALPRRRIVYSCIVGDPDPLAVVALMRQLAEGGGCTLEVLIHDFLPVSPSYTLLDSDGSYRGPVTAGRGDAAHVFRRPGGGAVPLAEWQQAWGALLSGAAAITVFSQDSARQLAAAYPALADRVAVRPHAAPPLPAAPAPAAFRGQRVVGVLGNIGAHKGAGIVTDLAGRLRADSERLVMVGTIDPTYALPAHVHVTGAYRPDDLPALIRQFGLTHWLIPSVWPETFSFTTHEALATGLPVIVFGLGAQADAVARAPNGIVVPYVPGGDLAGAALAALRAA